MPSSNKTKNLNLNYWAETDRPMRNDFNLDNGIIDQVVGSHIENNGIHLTSTEKAFVSEPYATMVYSGDGESSRSFTVTEVFSFVVVYAQGKPFSIFSTAESVVKTYAAVGHKTIGSSAGLTVMLNGTGFTVKQTGASQGYSVNLNESDVQYRVIMFR